MSLLKRRLNMDLAVCGIAAAKTNFNTSEWNSYYRLC